MASSRVMASSPPPPTASDLARFAAGKPGGGGGGLGSMNMEELLCNFYGDLSPADSGAGEEAQASPSPSPASAPARTAEEVWKEITGGGGGGGGGSEMTLEDFLAREDDVRVSASAAGADGQVVMGFVNGVEGVGGGGGGRGRKRAVVDQMDRATVQRQKRMIKNRESAARSRERKQAYIAELESLVTQLEEEKARLLREQEEQNQKRLKELKERAVPVIVREKKLPQALRRTNSMEW